jgi:hypothetical protein
MWQANPDGAGIAWSRKGHVYVVKGLMKFGDFTKAVARIPKGAPYVLHFRIQTVGGVRADLTHPFVVSEASPHVKRGKLAAPVLFHNGHWSDWRDKLLDSTTSTGTAFPDGPMSDSRAMAILAARHGVEIGSYLTSQRIVVLQADGTILRTGSGWSQHDDLGGVWTSNTTWKPRDLHRPKAAPTSSRRDDKIAASVWNALGSARLLRDADDATPTNAPLFTDEELAELDSATDVSTEYLTTEYRDVQRALRAAGVQDGRLRAIHRGYRK